MELLSNEKSKKEDEHDVEMVEVIAKVKASIVMALWQDNMKLAEDVANAGTWNLVGWQETLV